MASEKITAIVEELKVLTVLELSELVKAVEEEFGANRQKFLAEQGYEYKLVRSIDEYTNCIECSSSFGGL